MELGMIHRGEHSEITTVAGRTIDSEVSGNMLTCAGRRLDEQALSYQARTGSCRRKVGQPARQYRHQHRRAVEAGAGAARAAAGDEAVNECWIADRDASLHRLHDPQLRLAQPMIKQGGSGSRSTGPPRWATRRGLKRVQARVRRQRAGRGHRRECPPRCRRSRNCTCWPSWCARWAARASTPAPAARPGAGRARVAPMAGNAGGRVVDAGRELVVGSFLRKDHPLFAMRLRRAAHDGAHPFAGTRWPTTV